MTTLTSFLIDVDIAWFYNNENNKFSICGIKVLGKNNAHKI